MQRVRRFSWSAFYLLAALMALTEYELTSRTALGTHVGRVEDALGWLAMAMLVVASYLTTRMTSRD